MMINMRVLLLKYQPMRIIDEHGTVKQNDYILVWVYDYSSNENAYNIVWRFRSKTPWNTSHTPSYLLNQFIENDNAAAV